VQRKDWVREDGIAATQRRGEPPTRLADALRTARVIEAAEESARTGRFVRVAT
jgi:predicted dehydrogenase